MRGRLGSFLLLLLLSATASGEETVSFVSLDYPPYTGPSVKDGGAAERIVREILEPQGYRVVIAYRPWARVFVENRRFDAVLAMWPDSFAKMGLVDYLPLFRSRIGFFGRRNGVADVASLPSLAGQRIGTSRGYQYPRVLFASGLTLEEARSDPANLRKLAAGRLDLVAVERAVGQFWLAGDLSDLADQIVWLEPAFGELPLGIGVVPGSPLRARLAELLPRGLQALERSGRYATIATAYGVDRP
jgi:polar amino acid transport system substrate-binding protein